MARWYALNLAGQVIGPAFTAGDRTDAYDRGCALHGVACVTVQSVLSWEEDQKVAAALEKAKRRMTG